VQTFAADAIMSLRLALQQIVERHLHERHERRRDEPVGPARIADRRGEKHRLALARPLTTGDGRRAVTVTQQHTGLVEGAGRFRWLLQFQRATYFDAIDASVALFLAKLGERMRLGALAI